MNGLKGLREKMIKSTRQLSLRRTKRLTVSLRGAAATKQSKKQLAVGSRQALGIGLVSLRTRRRRVKQSIWMMTAAMFFIALALPNASFGMGLEVDPGEINLQNVPLGQKAAVSVLGGEPMKLRIKNKGAAACTYTIDILPSAKTTAVLNAGYKDIPDTAWIYPESKEVVVAGNSTKDVEIYLEIPKKKKYYNKKYQAVIEVKSKKNSPQELFVLACQLRILISTSVRR